MGLYPTADSFINIAATSNKDFATLCRLIGRDRMAADPRFASAGLRGRNKEALNELIATALRAKSSREWFDLLVAEGIPCGPVYTVKEVFEDPQVRALEIVQPVTHPRLGAIDLVAQPCEITGFDRTLRTATPDLGEHTGNILQSLGYQDKQIEAFKAAGVI